ncbi:MAG: 50S ribosomal protein L25 [Patescibacteria group bacterium]
MAAAHQKIELQAQPRTVIGHKVRHLRAEGLIPAVLYGKGQEALNLQIPDKDFLKVLKQAGESTLVYLNLEGQSYPTIIHDVSRDPLKDNVIHADFYKVRLDEKIKTSIPVVFVGESPAVTELKAIFVRNVNELEVEALPQDLPHEIPVDISGLTKFGDQILAKDIKLPAGVKLMAGEDEIIGTAQEPISEEKLKEELEAPTTDVSAVGEVEKEKKAEDEVEGEEAEAPTAVPPAPGTPPAASAAPVKSGKKEEKK